MNATAQALTQLLYVVRRAPNLKTLRVTMPWNEYTNKVREDAPIDRKFRSIRDVGLMSLELPYCMAHTLFESTDEEQEGTVHTVHHFQELKELTFTTMSTVSH